MQVHDIPWMQGLAAGLERARVERKPVALKPLGQGSGDCDDW
jgi:hypothetical protein